MIPIFDVDISRRNFLRNSLKAAVGTALVASQKKGRKPPAIGMPSATDQAKKVMKAGENVAAVKHAHDTTKTVGKVLNSPMGSKAVSRSSGLQAIRDRAGKIEKGLDKPIAALDKVGADAAMSRKQFLQKMVSVTGSGARKYLKYKMAPVKAIGSMIGPGTGGALKYLDPSLKKSALFKVGRMFASNQVDQIELKRLDSLGEYL